MKSFQRETIWITGASSGIGEALAIAFHREGANLILSARRAEELKRVKNSCSDGPGEVHILSLDLSRTETHQELVQEAISRFGQVDMLVNNGGISHRGLAHETRLEVVRRVMEVNFFGTVSLTRELMPHMLQRDSGHIVVISSVMGKFSTRFRSAYAASKHALHGWFDALRQECHNTGIDVTLVCPGYVNTPVTYSALQADGTPLNRMGEGQQQGMEPGRFADRLLPKLRARKPEIYIGGTEVAGVWLKRLAPRLLDQILARTKVT
ncbi:MAG: SDR family oxidoreductase [Balneolaceae bacterium]